MEVDLLCAARRHRTGRCAAPGIRPRINAIGASASYCRRTGTCVAASCRRCGEWARHNSRCRLALAHPSPRCGPFAAPHSRATNSSLSRRRGRNTGISGTRIAVHLL